jgi:hypothetical protein
VRINSLGTNERILEWRVEADGDRHMYASFRLRGDTGLASTWRGVWLPGRSTLGDQWVTLAFTTTRATDRRVRSTRAGWWRCSGRADRRHPFSTIGWQPRGCAGRHVAMWPHKLSDVHVDTYSWSGVYNVRRAHLKASPRWTRRVDGAGPRRTVVEWGTNA